MPFQRKSGFKRSPSDSHQSKRHRAAGPIQPRTIPAREACLPKGVQWDFCLNGSPGERAERGRQPWEPQGNTWGRLHLQEPGKMGKHRREGIDKTSRLVASGVSCVNVFIFKNEGHCVPLTRSWKADDDVTAPVSMPTSIPLLDAVP